jgi:hypothetical protein
MSSDFISLQLYANSKKNAERFGMKFSTGGVHQRRTMMLNEISTLIKFNDPRSPSLNDYKTAAIESNILGKKTATTRRETFKHLKELYLLSGTFKLFQVYRYLMLLDPESAPLLSFLAAWSRDPTLRVSTDVVLDARAGAEVPTGQIRSAIELAFPGRLAETTIRATSIHIASTWTQSSHLVGKVRKIRQIVQPRPAVVTFALYLARATGIDGERLFSSIWCRLLDLSSTQAREIAVRAHREGLLTMKALGSTVEITFPRFDNDHGGTE